MYTLTTIVRSSYFDSVVLMRVASQLKKREGVFEVAMFMGTEGNHELLEQVGLKTPESQDAGPQDLIVIVQARDDELAAAISSEATAMLTARRELDTSTFSYRPKTLERALGYLPDASLATISVPGQFAAREALRCLEHGLNVFLFSDNVSLAEERQIKERALEAGLLCMGPDCGTSYLNGAGLGFANIIARGRIGCVAASGTGLQALVCRLDQRGEGLSHGVGVGGRDLDHQIGGIMTTHALQLLEQDPATEVIVLISKPPDPEVAARLEAVCREFKTPVIAYFQGSNKDLKTLTQVATLDEAADRAVCKVRGEAFEPRLFEDPERIRRMLEGAGLEDNGRKVIGLFTGGTLAKECSQILVGMLGEVRGDLDVASCHAIVDLGDDRYTIGKPHPMIAPENRTEVLLKLAESGRLESCGVLLFDVVLGNGSHSDPSAELVQSLKLLRERYGLVLPAIVCLIGTEQDPQILPEQELLLSTAGLMVLRTNSEAARLAAMMVDSRSRARLLEKLP